MKTLAELEERLRASIGLARSGDRARAQLKRKLEAVREDLGYDLDEIDRRLETDAALRGRLASAMTVEETFFFRHPDQFAHMVDALAGMRMGEGRRPVVWSAGCSSGEEPYSVAIAIARFLGPGALERAQILATDVDAESLGKAREATYGEWSFRGVPPEVRQSCFGRVARGRFRLHEIYRRAVHFEHATVQEHVRRLSSESVDVVFFRNVAIYLQADVLRSLHTEIERVLVPGGLLLAAPTDPPVDATTLQRDRGGALGTYRKALQAAVSPPGGPASAGTSREATRRSAAAHATTAASVPRLDRALDLADRGMLDDALRLVEDAVREEPASTPARLARARILLGMGRPEAAAADLRAALFAAADDPMARYLYAAALFDLGRHRQGLAQLRGALRAVEDMTDDAAIGDGRATVGMLRRASRELFRQ